MRFKVFSLSIAFTLITAKALAGSHAYIDYYTLKLDNLIDIKAQLPEKDIQDLEDEKKRVVSEYSQLLSQKMKPRFKDDKELAKAVQLRMASHRTKKEIRKIFIKEMNQQLRFDLRSKARRCNPLSLRKALQNTHLENNSLLTLQDTARNGMRVLARVNFKSEDQMSIEMSVDNGTEKKSLDLNPLLFDYSKFSYKGGTKNCIPYSVLQYSLAQQLRSEAFEKAISSEIDKKKKGLEDASIDDELSNMIEVDN